MKILLTYDFLIADETQFNLPYWFDFIVKILRELGVEVDIFSKYTFNYSHKLFLKLCNIPSEVQLETPPYPLLYEDLTPQSVDYALSFLENYDLILIFEASDLLKKLLNDHSLRFIDMWVSPLRFLKDFLLCFYSNDTGIQATLKKYKIKESKIYKEAKVIADQFKHFIKLPSKLEDNSALVIAQLPRDKAVMKGRQFLTLLDFRSKIKEVSTKFKKLYFLPHPLMKQTELKTVIKELSDIKNLELLKGINSYFLLTREEIKTCLGISSSLLTEAKYFGKEVIFFYKPVIGNHYITVYKDYYNSSFWNRILRLNNQTHFSFLAHDNFLRNKFHPYSYNIFVERTEKQKYYRFLQNLYSSLKNLDKSKDYILYGIGSIGKLILPFLLKENIKIKAIADKYTSSSYIEGIKVIHPNQINNGEYVIVTPFIYEEEIRQELEQKECKLIFIS